MKYKDDVSSGSNFHSGSGVHYRNEREVTTFDSPTGTDSHGQDEIPLTWKVSRGSTKRSSSGYFNIDIDKLAREEDNFRLNQKLRGKKIIEKSSSSE